MLQDLTLDVTGSLSSVQLLNGLEVFAGKQQPIMLHQNVNSKIFKYDVNFNDVVVAQAFESKSISMLESVFEESGAVIETVDTKTGPQGPQSQTVISQINLNDGSFVSFVEQKKEGSSKANELVKAVFVGSLPNKKLKQVQTLLP